MRSNRVFVLILFGLLALLSACNPAVQVQGDFSLELSANALTNHQGQNGSLSLTLTRTNFSNSVQFAVGMKDGSALPDGITATFAPASMVGNSSSVTLAVADSVPMGSYEMRVKATSGSKEKTQDFTLSVDAKPNFELSVAGALAAIVRGQSGTATLNIARTNLPDDITLALEQADGTALPDGLTASFDASPTAANTSTLTLNVGTGVPAQTYSLRVKGSAGSLSKTSAAFSVTVQEVPSFALSFTTAPTSAIVGNSALGTIQIARTNFTGAVALSLEKSDGTALPSGITATFSPNNTATNSSTLTVNVGLAVAPGNYNLRVKGVSGSLTQTLPFALEVKAAPAFSLALAAAPAPVVQGQSVPVTLNITRTNFTNALTLSLEKSDGTAAPAGITATFNPNNTTGNTSAVTIATTAAVAPATYALRIKATSGAATNYVNFALEVRAIPNFELSLTAAPTPVIQGNNASITLNITRTNFTGNVALSLEKSDGTAVPTGITATFNPNNTAANSSTVTLSTTAAVVPGTYTLRFKGVSTTPSLTKTVAFSLEVQATPAFSLSLANPPATVTQGNSANVTLNIARTNFAGAIAFNLENSDGTAAPTGITASFNPNNTTANSSTVTLSTAASVVPGSYNLRIKGTSGSFTNTTAVFALTVLAPPDFSLSLGASSISSAQNSTAAQSVNISRTNFTDTVTLSLEKSDGSALPAGVTGSFASNPTTGNSTTLTVSVANTVPLGTYNLRVKGLGGGLTKYSSSFALVVASGTEVSVKRLLGSSYTTPWAAYQDGSGAWQSLIANNDQYKFLVTDPQGHYGIAIVCAYNYGGQTTGTSVNIYQFTTADTKNFNVSCGYYSNSTPSTFYRLTGTVNGFAANSSAAQISTIGGGSTVSPASPNFDVSIASGNQIISASRQTTTGDVDKLILLRDVLVNGDISRNFDFESSEAFALEGSYTINSSSVAAHMVAIFMALGAQNGVGTTLKHLQNASSLSYLALPAAKLQANDLYGIQLDDGDYSTGNAHRMTVRYAGNPISGNFDLPSVAGISTSVVSNTPYMRLQNTWNKSGTTQLYGIAYSMNSIYWQATASANWLGNTNSYTMPDFSSNASWQNLWGIPSYGTVTWSGGTIESSKNFDTALFMLNSSAYAADMATIRSLLIDTTFKQSTISGTISGAGVGAAAVRTNSGGYSSPILFGAKFPWLNR